MRIKIQIGFCLGVILILIIVSPKPALSYHQKQVLGDGDSNVITQLPQTAEGPGLILPDSPLFFLDKIKQNIRLLFAYTPEEKARVHNLIAGERYAESRAMLGKDNEDEAENSLKMMEEEFEKAAMDLEKARIQGQDISVIAREINNNIKEKYYVLDELRLNTVGPFGIRLEAVSDGILRAKVRVEDVLPKDELEREIEEHLKRKIDNRIKKASKSVEELEEDLRLLDRKASDAAEKSISEEEESVEKALKDKDELQIEGAERRLEKEKRRLERLLKAKEKAREQVLRALEKYHEAVEAYREVHELIRQIDNEEELDEEREEEEVELELEFKDEDEDIGDLEGLQSPPVTTK